MPEVAFYTISEQPFIAWIPYIISKIWPSNLTDELRQGQRLYPRQVFFLFRIGRTLGAPYFRDNPRSMRAYRSLPSGPEKALLTLPGLVKKLLVDGNPR